MRGFGGKEGLGGGGGGTLQLVNYSSDGGHWDERGKQNLEIIRREIVLQVKLSKRNIFFNETKRNF